MGVGVGFVVGGFILRKLVFWFIRGLSKVATLLGVFVVEIVGRDFLFFVIGCVG